MSTSAPHAPAGAGTPLTHPGEPPGTAPNGEAGMVGEAEMVEEELLVEEISIDGMCGVY